MSYSLMYMSTCSPLYVSHLPDWHLRDCILDKLVKEHDVEIHVPIPQAGNTKLMERVYNGDTKPLYHTLRDLNIKFYPEINTDIELDGALLEGLAFFQDIDAFGKHFTAKEQEDAMFVILDKLVEGGKPIVLLDNDYVCSKPFNGDNHFLEVVYKKYKGYNNLTVIAPMTEHLEGAKFKRLPFPIDVNTIRETIIPYEERNCLCRYLGNNYNKTDTHIPVFKALSEFGYVHVSGYRWSQEDRALAPKVKFGTAISLSQDSLYNTLGKSILGISGYSTYQRDEYKDLYHYRWKEFLIAGTYIVTENCKELIDLMPEGNLVFDEISKLSYDELKERLAYIKDNYINLVKEQRDRCLDLFRVENILPHYLEALEIE